jgi:hypothetical protein
MLQVLAAVKRTVELAARSVRTEDDVVPGTHVV